MRHGRRFLIGAAAMTLLAFLIGGCQNPVDLMGPTTAPNQSVVAGSPAIAAGDLIAGRSMKAGTVEVGNDTENLYVTYRLEGGWVMTESHLEVALSLDGIPQTKTGNPIPGQFRWKRSHDPPAVAYMYKIGLGEVGFEADDLLYLAAHAEVRFVDGTGTVIRQESAWAAGIQFPGKNWATCFTYQTVTAHPAIYDANSATGGSVPVDPARYLPGQTVMIMGNPGNLVKDGYVFAGWNTHADGTGSTYAEGQAFLMGGAEVTLYALWLQPSLDLTGYWDMYLSILGMPAEMGPELFGILQTGSELDCSKGMFGTIVGSAVTLESLYGPDHMVMTGTATEDEIIAPFTDMPPFGSGTLRFVRTPQEFGRMDLEGTCQGVPVSVHSDFGFATRTETMTHHSNRIELNMPPFNRALDLVCLEPSTDSPLEVVSDYPIEPGKIQVSLGWEPGNRATTGSVTFSRYDADGMAGEFTLEFPLGSLTGYFDVVLGDLGCSPRRGHVGGDSRVGDDVNLHHGEGCLGTHGRRHPVPGSRSSTERLGRCARKHDSRCPLHAGGRPALDR